MSLEDCLPPELRGADTTIARVAAGLSGAGVYRVDAAGQTFVLKISSDAEPLGAWRHRLHIRQLAAHESIAPRVIHVDEDRRAVLSDFVVDRSFPALYWNPETHEAAFGLLARTLRRLHEIPLPPETVPGDPRDFLASFWPNVAANMPVPEFVSDAVRRVLVEEPPPRERAVVLSHNDVNPTNLVYDGENLLLLDWDTAGANDPYYDLAAISVFLRMNEETCRKLLASYDGAPVAALPVRFVFNQRLVAVMCGAMFLHLARNGGHAGAGGNETVDSTPSLGEVYQRMRSGALSPATSDGQWSFGLALLKESVAL